MMNSFKHNITSNYQMFFHQAGSCQMEGIVSLYNYIMTYLVGILFVVTTALIFIIYTHMHGYRHIKQIKEEKDLIELVNWMRFLQKWTHSTTLELVWTIIPTIILIAIAIPSFILLYSLDEIVDTQCIVKIIAYQWYWKYEYPVLDPLTQDILSFSYLSYMLPLDDLNETNNLRLLEVDTPLVLPINVNTKLVITSKDVIHSFAVPALGVKMDAVPGRLNQVTVHIFKPGTYYGQCSELCGVNHAFMPIVINAVHFTSYEIFLVNGIEKLTNNVIAPFQSSESAIKALELYSNFLKAMVDLKPIQVYEIFYDVMPQRNEIVKRAYLLVSVLSSQTPEINAEGVDLTKAKIISVNKKIREIILQESDLLWKNYGAAREYAGHLVKYIPDLFIGFSHQPGTLEDFLKSTPVTKNSTQFFLTIPHDKSNINNPFLNIAYLVEDSTFNKEDSIFNKPSEMTEYLNSIYNTPARSEIFIKKAEALSIYKPTENFFDYTVGCTFWNNTPFTDEKYKALEDKLGTFSNYAEKEECLRELIDIMYVRNRECSIFDLVKDTMTDTDVLTKAELLKRFEEAAKVVDVTSKVATNTCYSCQV